MADVTPEPIMRIAMGFMPAKNLVVASAIGICEKLAEGRQRPQARQRMWCAGPHLVGQRRCDAESRPAGARRRALLQRAGAATFLAGNPGPALECVNPADDPRKYR